ncbi:hypothetical protein BJF92_12170 [Rhizobium rhizosphaerae]|uniref:Head-tail adaptor protein n=1 Tax=Xaviernesmea rhizosphaerae TaxID=1672749 RepID=A0A1Q9AN45_9HYPH|nr:hypothetical protein [Xaviernesmea rhizosphaerae]OLP56820.1 hypothetical protein BJF92_12170 [Xaviernesmea rhizosphaerae]
MVDWAAARAFTEHACSGIFDLTPCRLVGMRTGQSVNHPEAEDPGRPPFDFLGSIDLQPPPRTMMRALPSDPGTTGGIVSYDAVLSARMTEWPWRPVKRDVVLSGGKSWRIETIDRDGSDRATCYLMEVRHALG